MAKATILSLAIFVVVAVPQLLSGQTSGASSNSASVAQAAAAQSERVARLEQQAADAKNSADNAWMLTSAALVLMMTGPGLALFYGGLVRKKNVLATMMQSLAMMALI